MAGKQGNTEIGFKTAHLARNGRLAQVQLLGGMGKAAGICDGMKYAQLVPVHLNFPSGFPVSLLRRDGDRFMGCNKLFRFKGCHASHTCCSDSLTVNVVGYVTGGENPWYLRSGGIGCRPQIA